MFKKACECQKLLLCQLCIKNDFVFSLQAANAVGPEDAWVYPSCDWVEASQQTRTRWRADGASDVKTGENLGKRAILTGSSQNLISTGRLFKVTGQSVDNMVHVFCSRYDFKH